MTCGKKESLFCTCAARLTLAFPTERRLLRRVDSQQRPDRSLRDPAQGHEPCELASPCLYKRLLVTDTKTFFCQGVTFIGNSTSIQSLFTRINTQFSAMVRFLCDFCDACYRRG